MEQENNSRRILRLKQVLSITGLSRATLYKQINKGKFPKQLMLTERCVGWDEAAIQAWLAVRQQA